ncbi:MAG: BREX system Lon protease-like protein BrxL [Methylococcaceae bacterium]|nr:BREX system Lon protease-like protein BrxL [Methylococcaceae bacterium]
MIESKIQQQHLDQKILETFGELTIDKKSVRELKIREARTITSFVEEWLVSRYLSKTSDKSELYQAITDFMSKHLPKKTEKESIKNRLLSGDSIVLLDKFSVRIDVTKGLRLVSIPCLELNDAQVIPDILDKHDELLSGGQWGAGRLHLREEKGKNVIELIEFNPMQSGRVRLDKVVEARGEFTTEEWIYLLIRTMGYEPSAYTPQQRRILLLRMLPLIHKNINMMELAPKGTGKSYIFTNLSRYVWLNSGGALTQAQLFKNLNTKEIGLLGKHDLLVLDEGQSISFKGADDIHAKFKDYLESGRYSIGGHEVPSECGLMILANIEIFDDKPLREDYIRHLPEMFHDDALMDRFHGIIPGWEIPRFTTERAAQGIGIKADVFGEYVHQLRTVSAYGFSYGQAPELKGDIRDVKAVQRLSMALSKLLMLNSGDPDYQHHVFEPACKLRERVRSQLAALNPNEFSPGLKITSSQG